MSNTPEFRRVSAGRGLDWITEGFGLFRQAPLPWIAVPVLWFLAAALVSLVPLIGSLAVNLTVAVVLGGILLGAHAQRERGHRLKLESLWAGFSAPHLQPLLLLGLVYLVLGLVIGVIAGGLVFVTLGSAVIGGDISGVNLGLGSLLSLLVVLLLIVAFSLATWFAPGLIVFAGLPPIEALKVSFSAAMANLGALAVYGLLTIVIALVASIPFGLGLLVAIPVFMAALYCAYRDVFGIAERDSLP